MKKSRKRSGRKYPRRKLWIERRDAVFARAGEFCEISGVPLLIRIDDSPVLNPSWKWKRAADHIWPERFVRRFIGDGADPHILENLVVITPSLHAKKTAIEYLIFRADKLGYLRELNRLGYPQELIDRAMQALCASVRKSEESKS